MFTKKFPPIQFDRKVLRIVISQNLCFRWPNYLALRTANLRADELNFPSRQRGGRSIERNAPAHTVASRESPRIPRTSVTASTWYATDVQTRQCVYITTVIGEWVAGAVKATAATTGVAEPRGDGGGERGWRRRWPWTWLPSLFAHSRCVARPKQPTSVDVGPASTRRWRWRRRAVIFIRDLSRTYLFFELELEYKTTCLTIHSTNWDLGPTASSNKFNCNFNVQIRSLEISDIINFWLIKIFFNNL